MRSHAATTRAIGPRVEGVTSTSRGPATPEKPAGLLEELRDAVSLRTVLLVVGVLLVQLAFVASYVGAFHKPTPHDVSLGVVAPQPQARQLTQRLDAAAGHPLSPEVVADRATAVQRVRSADLAGARVRHGGRKLWFACAVAPCRRPSRCWP